MDHVGTADAEDDPGSLPRLAPSPHSEAVAHEFKELSLQPSQCLPPLNERKNGECNRSCSPFALLFSLGIMIFVCSLQITSTVLTCLSQTTFCGVKVPIVFACFTISPIVADESLTLKLQLEYFAEAHRMEAVYL